jgi:hypothetical protein
MAKVRSALGSVVDFDMMKVQAMIAPKPVQPTAKPNPTNELESIISNITTKEPVITFNQVAQQVATNTVTESVPSSEFTPQETEEPKGMPLVVTEPNEANDKPKRGLK